MALVRALALGRFRKGKFMATLVLGTVGTLIGGPLGGAVGTFLGQAIDSEVFGAGAQQGPRLEELSVSTSSYGQPLARHYGRTRTAGSIIWATDFQESSDTSGGKGQPKTTTYSYSASLAVAISARPIDAIGRIWADGNLLRGEAGDLKTGGTLRIYTGHKDQDVDPLLAADLGAQCPAHRGLAYVVFEDLQLADFGNRIPAITFEVFSGSGADLAKDVLQLADATGGSELVPLGMEGFSYKTGSARQIMQLLDTAGPLAVKHGQLPLEIAPVIANNGAEPAQLSQAAAWEEGEFGQQSGTNDARSGASGREAMTIRYYDVARDYQPGLQRSSGRSPRNGSQVLEFPASFSASDARNLAQAIAHRRDYAGEKMLWRTAELDPNLGPGDLVRIEDRQGLWRIEAWEWRSGGIDLELARHPLSPSATGPTDAGAAWLPLDRLPAATLLRAFELPWDGFGNANTAQVFVAVSAEEGRWAGARLFASSNGSLTDLSLAPNSRAIVGETQSVLSPSQSLLMHKSAQLQVSLAGEDMQLEPASAARLAAGANRVLIGEEIIQFADAREEEPGSWVLTGLIRGRGGSETKAQTEHPIGTPITLLDDRLTPLVDSPIDPASDAIAAIGLAETDPVIAEIENAGGSRKPLTPVHPRLSYPQPGSLHVCWTRRARGSWSWQDEVEVPLVEQSESYQLGIGPIEAPLMEWQLDKPEAQLVLGDIAAQLSGLQAGQALWVRQNGSFARSDPLFLTTLD
jgi:hypothetical protein